MSEQHNLKEQLCFSLYNAQRQVNRYYSNKVFKKYNLTYPQFLVLSILWDESPVNVKKVVTELALDTGTVSPLLKEWNKLTSSNANVLKLITVKYLFILLRKAKNSNLN